MNLRLENVGKRFNTQWIFKNLNLEFQSGISYAITGANGAGKSTLLQIAIGIVPQTKGKITYFFDNRQIPVEEIFKHLSFSAPYQELIEEFTLTELLDFHLKFRNFRNNISRDKLIDILNLYKNRNKQLRFFSSGMKQRVKLGLALYTQSSLIVLDEPTTNLDANGIDWYRSEIDKLLKDNLVLIGSNQPVEYDFCDRTIKIGPDDSIF